MSALAFRDGHGLEQEDLLPLDDPGSDNNNWQDNIDPPPSLVSGNVPSLPHHNLKSSSSSSLATPLSLSQPSGLPWNAISNLTYDELLLNNLFTRYVSLVNILLNKDNKPLPHQHE